MALPKDLQQFSIADPVRLIDDKHDLVVARLPATDLLVGGIGGGPSNPTIAMDLTMAMDPEEAKSKLLKPKLSNLKELIANEDDEEGS